MSEQTSVVTCLNTDWKCQKTYSITDRSLSQLIVVCFRCSTSYHFSIRNLQCSLLVDKNKSWKGYFFVVEVLVSAKVLQARTSNKSSFWYWNTFNRTSLSGRKPIFGACNKKLENWHGMRLFQKVKSVSLEWTVSEHSRATYQNASLNQFITFVRKPKDKRSSSLGDKLSVFYPRFENFKFFLYFD